MNLECLITFCTVVQERGFSAAARRLNLTQPTVSHHVGALERTLGFRMLERGRNPLILTEAGRRLYPHIEQCVVAFRRVEALTYQLRQGRAELRLSTIFTVGELLLPGLLTSFRGRHPGVVLTVMVGDRSYVSRSVLDGTTDVGISFRVQGDPDLPKALRVVHLYDEALRLVVSRTHPWARTARLRQGDLAEGEFILRSHSLATRRLVDASLDVSRFRVLMEVGSNEALRAAVKAGLGAGFVYGSALDDDLAAVDVEGFDVKRDVVAVALRGTRLPSLARDFLDVVREQASCRL